MKNIIYKITLSVSATLLSVGSAYAQLNKIEKWCSEVTLTGKVKTEINKHELTERPIKIHYLELDNELQIIKNTNNKECPATRTLKTNKIQLAGEVAKYKNSIARVKGELSFPETAHHVMESILFVQSIEGEPIKSIATTCKQAQAIAETAALDVYPRESRYVSSDGRLYFHSAPSDQCKLTSFIIPKDDVTVYQRHNEWSYVMYVHPKTGEDTSGWVHSRRLELRGTFGMPTN